MDIDIGNTLIKAIRPLANTTNRKGVVGNLGGFGGLFDLKASGYEDPILIAATDGVGTKLKIAQEIGMHDSIGIDLVAMCVNDIVVQGGEPLFFLDYFATGKLDNNVAKKVIKGIAEGCLQSGCALIGGETAEMPGMYVHDEYDLAGFSVGAAERNGLLPRDDIIANDVILGLPSNGLHSNGFSLVREIIRISGIELDKPAPFDKKRKLGEAILDPTRIYVKSCLTAIKSGYVKALAHITGGGLIENIPRILPEGHGAELYADSWQLPGIFSWLAGMGSVDPMEMAHTFNCGVGMIIITAPDKAKIIQNILHKHGDTAIPIGKVIKSNADDNTIIHNIGTWKANYL